MTTLPLISLPDDRYRRFAGFALGALVGVTFATVWQYGDRLSTPGVPLYLPPFGIVGNIAAFALGAGLLGLIVGWSRSGLHGAFVAAAVSAVALVGWSFVQAAEGAAQNLAATFVAGFFLTLPFWGLLVPVLGIVRWAVSNDEEARRDHERWWRRAWRPLLLLLIVGLLGLTALHRPEARVMLARTHQMLQTAQAGGLLPAPLADTEFAARGQGAYALSWEGTDIEKYRIPRPGKNFNQHSVVVARFANGWNLVCLYISLEDPPQCQGREELPR